ncbi:hypothetical protein BD289DRAFT_505782 [Coniella lustricola]|uniref:Uncharacterized protein n=1 Tax=Coniella lustricola TaxID=2025994 RepID=A0A2T3A913_9PEZI|nr:hypothetical protein BD289DRAFT_505782 [Coniella lustricola]
MSAIRSSLARQTLARRQPLFSVARRSYASAAPGGEPSKAKGLGGIPIALGAVAVIIPGSLYLLSNRHEAPKHNDHAFQGGVPKHARVEDVRRGHGGSKMHGTDDISKDYEEIETDLPRDALNHPVNRAKMERAHQLKPPTKRVDATKSVN